MIPSLDQPIPNLPKFNPPKVVIAGGGPTAVELAGAMAELRNNVFPKVIHWREKTRRGRFAIC